MITRLRPVIEVELSFDVPDSLIGKSDKIEARSREILAEIVERMPKAFEKSGLLSARVTGKIVTDHGQMALRPF